LVVEKVGLQELGPRFTLKLLWIKRSLAGSGEHGKGVSPTDADENGQVEWIWHPSLQTSKRKFFL